MKTKIPIYRAKKIDCDEYVEGHYAESYEQPKHGKIVPLEERLNVAYIKSERSDKYYTDYDFHEIDITTLAIHFPNMMDKNGKKIFASLNDNCIGASIVDRITKYGRIYDSIDVEFQYINHLDVNLFDYNTPELTLEVVGIKENDA